MVSSGTVAADGRSSLAPAIFAALPGIVVALLVVAHGWSGLMPGVGFWDTGEFQTIPPILGTAHPTGYPTYVIVGFIANLILAPLGEPAFRMNLLSLIAVGVAAGATTILVRRLAGSLPIAIATAAGLALTPIVWRIGLRADPHALHLALVAVILALLVRWEGARRDLEAHPDRWLVAASIAFGLSIGNHSLTLLLAVPVGLYVLAVQPRIVLQPRLLATCALALLGVTVLVFLEPPLRAGVFRAPLVYADPATWDGFWYIALAEQFRGSLSEPLGHLAQKWDGLVTLAVSLYGPLAALIPIGFLATLRRAPRYALLTGSAMVITTLFDASYSNADISRYYLGPVLWAWTWIGVLGGVVVERVMGVPKADASVAAVDGGGGARTWPRTALAIGLAAVIIAPSMLAYPGRQKAVDRHADTAAAHWLDAALPSFKQDAVVVSWWSASTALWYAQYVEGRRPDLFVVDDRTRLDRGFGEATDVIAKFLGQRPVYVIRANPYDLGLVEAQYELARVPATDGTAVAVYEVIGPARVGS